MQTLQPVRAIAATAVTILWLCPAAGAEPGPLPPELVETFTKSIQPLLLNRCATGGCHAGRTGHEPLLRRHNAVGQIDREVTLANIRALRLGAETSTKARDRTATLAVSHPGRTGSAPLSTAQMNTLRSWLVAASEADEPPNASHAFRTAAPAPVASGTARPNRFRDLLDSARNPAPLWPPPQEPRGVILKDDLPAGPAEEP